LGLGDLPFFGNEPLTCFLPDGKHIREREDKESHDKTPHHKASLKPSLSHFAINDNPDEKYN
jgi:hypothetical protein